MKLGVEAALVDGVFVDGDVEIVDGRIVRCGLARRRAAAASPFRASSTCR